MTKTILITGSTDGIGLLTAQLLVTAGHRVLLHGRSAAKLEAVADDLGGDTEIFLADLSDLRQVDALADAVRNRHERLDVLINNAGVFKTPKPVARNGLDVRFMVNTLAPYRLTRLLLPNIPATGRIINLSSAAQAPVDLVALKGDKALGDMEAYAQSKLAITLWSETLAKELPGGPIVLAVNPGSLLASKMVRDGFGVAGNDLHIGADLLVRMATTDDFNKDSGRYWDNDAGHFSHIDSSQAVAVVTTMEAVLDGLA
ncbi:MAG: SDR family NAD(P)-dependent oxidoreductase [Pseudomonadota bacterium]